MPANKKAYSDGKGSKPVQPIRFYLDNTFPEAWKEPIKKGVLLWNKAFEKIGYKDVLEVVDFPTDDPKSTLRTQITRAYATFSMGLKCQQATFG